MKLTIILLLAGALHLSATTYSQTVTLSRRTSSLKNIFREIKKQTGYYFFYKGQLLQGRPEVMIELKNASLTDALNASLKGQDLNFNIVNKTIVISSTERLPLQANARVTKTDVRGQVVDKTSGELIPGVNISLKNGPNIGITNEKGEFLVNVNEGAILVFSYVGYELFEVKANTVKSMTIKLVSKQTQMNDVVITGYQTIKKENYTGNAITIKGDELKKNNPQNLLKSIQSFDPSFKVLDNNLFGSDPNALPKINVRGATALPSIADTENILDRNNLSSNYNLPAFMLDGFEVTLQKVTDLDINRIESVTLLKDAAATAVYGSRAANGVIVITTKAPVAGKLQLSYNYELSVNAPDLTDYHVLDAKDKLAYEKLAGLYNASLNAAYNQEQLDAEYFSRLKNVASGVDTYWLSQALRNAYRQKHSLYVQGGDQKFRYGVDLRYETQPGVMLKSDRNRYSGGMNFTYNPTSKLLFRNEISITQVNGNNSPYGDFSTYVRMNPYYPKTNQNGDLIQEIANWEVDTHLLGDKQFKTTYVFNPLFEGELASFDKSSNLELIDAFSVDWKLSPSLTFKSQISLNKSKVTGDKFVSPLSSKFYSYASDKLNNKGSYTLIESDRLAIDGKATLGYNKQIGEQYFNLVLGTNVVTSRSDDKLIEAQGFSNDRFTNIGFARIYKEDSAPGGNVSEKRLAGAFFSGNYSYQNKYLLDASFRYEGSSAFGSNKRFAPFWSTGIGWNMHKESFMENLKVISQLRLKASTGIVGSVSFPAYLSKSIYQYEPSNWYSTGLGAQVLGYGNSNLQWQKTKTYDVGIDLGLLQDRFVISPRYYYKLTKGLITDIDLSPSTGFTTYKENLGDMANEGYELYLTANAFRNKDFNINITGNLAHNVNTLVKLSNSLKTLNDKIDQYQTNPDKNAQSTPLLRYNEGQSLTAIYAVRSLGIDPENGKEIFLKKDGSVSYQWDVKDIMPVADGAPKAEGNLSANIGYKNFMVSLSFYYRFGGYSYNQTLVDRIENADPRFNVDSRVLDQRWIKPGDQTFFKNIADLSITNVSSRFVQKDDLLELRSIYLSYDFNRDTIKKLGFQNLRTTMTLNDIFRTSSIQMERGTSYPFARSLTVSLLASF
ncbi:SusC/RagA family TonB-linked outer membrane protein [Pedobacter jamesrossensis]|uniref:SusC/RagA family TonB-linked outer membrane protein n=1 Tax=Pedobacter jamesrossensis TaxID=1908238 RepID=A0ABV8NR74_9SPHI